MIHGRHSLNDSMWNPTTVKNGKTLPCELIINQ